MSNLFLGVDVGTNGVRAAVFDAGGRCVSSACASLSVVSLGGGFYEQRPAELFSCLGRVVAKCLRGVDGKRVRAMALDGTTCTLLCVGGKGRPLRNAILWMDCRAGGQAERLNKANAVTGETGHKISPEMALPKALWIKENEPAVYRKARFVEAVDWLNFRLTGGFNGSFDSRVRKWLWVPEKGYPVRALARAGIPDFAEKAEIGVLGACSKIGPLKKSFCRKWGLGDVLVVQAPFDSYAEMIGLGVVKSGGTGCVIVGSSAHVYVIPKKGVVGRGNWGPYPLSFASKPNVVGGLLAAGSVIKWFKRNFCQAEVLAAKQAGLDFYSFMGKRARKISAGSGGLLIIPYFQGGNRNPLCDPYMKSLVSGLGLETSKAHFLRAIYEGIAFGLNFILEDFKEKGIEVKRLNSPGGGVRSNFLLQIIADVMNVPVHVSSVSDAAALGCAICAATGFGEFKNIGEATSAMTSFRKKLLPNKKNHAVYKRLFKKYKAFHYNKAIYGVIA